MAQLFQIFVYEDKSDLLYYIDADGTQHTVTSIAEWTKHRAHILASMQLVMGRLPGKSKLVPLDIEITEETEFPKYIQRKISFAAEKNDRVPAYLLTPKGLVDKSPAMLCPHQTITIGKGEPAGLGGNPNLHYAKELVERGYITLAPDYPRFGDYKISPYDLGYHSATMKGIWNHMRAIDLLQSLPEVEGDRIGCIGHSLGGHNTLFLSAFDERIKVAVTSCGFTSFFKNNLMMWSHGGYMPRIATRYGADPGRMPFDFTEVLAAIAPRPVFVNAPLRDEFDISGVEDCLKAASSVYSLYVASDNLVAVHPDCGHDFPSKARESAYSFIDKYLK